MGPLSHYKFHPSPGICFKPDFYDIPLTRIRYSPSADGCYFKLQSGNEVEKLVELGLDKDRANGEKVQAGKIDLFLGFLFHFVKEKGYTRGTGANKGHCSHVAISSLPFFM